MPDIAGFLVGGGSLLVLALIWLYCDELEDGNVGAEPDETNLVGGYGPNQTRETSEMSFPTIETLHLPVGKMPESPGWTIWSGSLTHNVWWRVVRSIPPDPGDPLAVEVLQHADTRLSDSVTTIRKGH